MAGVCEYFKFFVVCRAPKGSPCMELGVLEHLGSVDTAGRVIFGSRPCGSLGASTV